MDTTESDARSYIHRRFGPSIARRILRVWFAVVAVMLFASSIAPFALPAEHPKQIRSVATALSCVAAAFLWRMYRSTMAELEGKQEEMSGDGA
jgi:peptidoglycan/LPS O-acetylase OafA/YrhL